MRIALLAVTVVAALPLTVAAPAHAQNPQQEEQDESQGEARQGEQEPIQYAQGGAAGPQDPDRRFLGAEPTSANRVK